MFERIRAVFVGALLGLAAYVAHLTNQRISCLAEPQSWSLAGPIKWFLLGGALIGFVGGLSFVESWLEQERGELVESAVVNGLFSLALIAFAIILFISLRHQI